MIEECQISALLDYLSARKMVNLLFQRVWWPKLHASVSDFYKECEVCAKTKDLAKMPPGALQLSPVPP